MQSDLTINGVAASTYGVLFEHPSLEKLLSFASAKPPISNSSRHEDGIQVIEEPAKVESREVQLYIAIKGESETDFFDRMLAFEELLRNGQTGSGITHIGFERFLWRLRFDSCEALRIFAGNTGGKFTLSFIEPDPTNRFAQ